jgi:23S rRNA pseudouridine2605 synthase
MQRCGNLKVLLQPEKQDMYKRGSNSGRNSGDARGGKTPFKKTTGSGRPKTGDRTSDRKPAGERKSYSSRGGDGDKAPRKTGSYNREGSSDRKFSDRKPYSSRGGDGERTPRKTGSFNREGSSDRKSYGSRGGERDGAPRKTGSYNREGSSERKPYGSRGGERDGDRAPRKTATYNREGSTDRKFSDRKPTGDRKPYGSRGGERDEERTPRKTGTYNREGSSDRKFSDRKPTGDRKPYSSRGGERDEERAPRKTGTYNREGSTDRKFSDRKPTGDRKPYSSRGGERDEERAPRKTGTYNREGSTDRKFSDRKPTGDRKPYSSRGGERDEERAPRKTSSYNRESSDRKSSDRKPAARADREYAGKPVKEEGVKSRSGRGPRKSDLIFDKKKAQKDDVPAAGNIRLNRYIANAGICSRREADDLITAGVVSINGVAVTEMGYQVKPSDEVRYNGQLLSREKKVYLLLNKPKDAITTFEDPEGRRTVMELFGNELGERIYPVGRLDRNTTGVLLFTNDGDVAQRLMHPKYEMTKVYKATLDKNFKGEDLWQLQNGIELEDGFVKPDAIAIPDAKNKNEVGVEIHSGKNRIIHRIFEHFGYKVDKLDRALYGGLTKGKLKRGEWRHLTEKEVNTLKRMVKLS